MTIAHQKPMSLGDVKPIATVDGYEFEPIKGYPMLNWKGKRPFTSTQYYPAQLKEVHGEAVDGWHNKVFWGDNLQVMSHLLKEFRGKVQLVYIDPPYDSKADYRQTIQLKGSQTNNDYTSFEEKQYTDIWTNDEYLQFVYERIILIRELLSDTGSILVHCDYHKNYLIRLMLDEVFGIDHFINEIVWRRKGGSALAGMKRMSVSTDTILMYGKSQNYKFNDVRMSPDEDYIKQMFTKTDSDGRKFMITVISSPSFRQNLVFDYKGYSTPPNGWRYSKEKMKELDSQGLLYFPEDKSKQIYKKIYLDEYEGQVITSLWTDISLLKGKNSELTGYPTQKPEELLERIVNLSTDPGDLVFDCFMGSGTTQAVAMKLGRRFIGADINLGAVQITTKRLLGVAAELNDQSQQIDFETSEAPVTHYTGFEVYNVNHYDLFRNPIEAKNLLLEALEVNRLEAGHLYDGEKDGRMVKVMPVTRIATRADLSELIAGFDYKAFETRQNQAPGKPVEKITLICMGHELDLAAVLINEAKPYKIDVIAVDILRDKQDLQFKRDSEAKIVAKNGKLVIKKFYPLNLLQKLSLLKENVEDWRELVESIMIDWNYDGAIFTPTETDIPDKDELVKGEYPIPDDAGTIRVKITDLLSESLERDVEHG